MGIYPDHGVEYIVFLKSETLQVEKLIIASTKDTDDRLVQSEYYKKRKDEWFTTFHGLYDKCEPINDYIDIELTETEKELLNKVINRNPGEIQKHGWYDVWHFYSTY